MGLAIQLLQCKPESFVSQKVASVNIQIASSGIYNYLVRHSLGFSSCRKKFKPKFRSMFDWIRIHIQIRRAAQVVLVSSPKIHITFYQHRTVRCHRAHLRHNRTPTATVSLTYHIFNFNGQLIAFHFDLGSSKPNGQNTDAHNDDETISPLGMAKYLEDKLKAANVKHCDTCSCASRDLRVLADIDQTYSVGVQTTLQGDATHSLCLRCNINLNSPSSTSSPFLVNVVKSSDSIISETKSSMSCNGSSDKIITKRDELTVNPILGHNAIVCDRTKSTIKTTTAEQIRNNINEATAHQATLAPQQHHLKLDGSPIDSNHQQTRPGIAGSSMSSSSRTSFSGAGTNLDGSKIFESFNRNLIKSIKVRRMSPDGRSRFG